MHLTAKPNQQQPHLERQPYTWLVPAVLLVGVVVTLVAHWPLYIGLCFGYLGSAVYALACRHTAAEVVYATQSGIRTMWRVCVMLLLVGGVVALWMVTGTIPCLMAVGQMFLHPDNILWGSFLAAAVLSTAIGSCIATWSVLGPPLMAMAPVSLAPILAGALVSGGMVGDRSSPMSASAVLISTTTHRTHRQTLRQLNLTGVVPFLATLLAFWIVNSWFGTQMSPHMPGPASPVGLTAMWPALLPVVVIACALLQVPLLYNLLGAIALSLAVSVWHGTSARLALGCMWTGVTMQSQHHPLHIGGVKSMADAVVLVAVAGAFQGVTALSRCIESLTQSWFAHIRSRVGFLLASYLLCLLFSLVMGSQMLSVVMSADTLRPEINRRGLPQADLTQVVGDAAELFPAIVPWNLLGLQSYAILRVPTADMMPYAWFIIASILCSVVLVGVHWLHRNRRFATPMA